MRTGLETLHELSFLYIRVTEELTANFWIGSFNFHIEHA